MGVLTRANKCYKEAELEATSLVGIRKGKVEVSLYNNSNSVRRWTQI